MVKVVVVGGGWSGCAAALAAAKAGADVRLIERTDMLLGTGLVGGIFRNNGRYTAAEEITAMGGGELIAAMDGAARHQGIDFPGHRHASFYDVTKIEAAVRAVLKDFGIAIETRSRIVDVVKYGKTIQAVVEQGGEKIAGNAFVDATGSSGPIGNCLKYGNGCAMCVLRCASFGPRVALTAKAGVKEIIGRRADGGFGAMSGSCKLNKETLAPELRECLERDGFVVVPVPKKLQKNKSILERKACIQYALHDYVENLIVLDTGHAKLMTPFMPLDTLRAVPGFETARYEDPYAGGVGNSIRYLGIAPADRTLKVEGIDNLFCAGEKAGLIVGHTEAIVTGLLAGHNAVRCCLDMEYLELSRQTASGDFIAYVREQMATEEGVRMRYSFSGSLYFERMKARNLCSTDPGKIKEAINRAGLTDVYSRCLV